MNGDNSSAREAPLPLEVTIQLLDPAYRRPVKTWKFVDRKSIRIGRGDDVDVEISDAYVSRVHAELLHRDGQWNLISRGRNGVLVGSQTITELPCSGEIVFRLGSAGPSLRFNTAAVMEAASATLCFTADANPLLHLDETKLQDEVAQIANDDYFQKLQQKVKELRRQKVTNDETRLTNQ
jgi:pSer/pThr/pTyr-binding forkhead associated (FHA) protein